MSWSDLKGWLAPNLDNLLWRDRVLSMKMHLPATVAVNPNSGYVCFAGHRTSATGGLLRGVIHEGSDIRAEEDDMGIKELNGRESALRMELLDEGDNLIPVPYLLFDTDEVGQKEF